MKATRVLAMIFGSWLCFILSVGAAHAGSTGCRHDHRYRSDGAWVSDSRSSNLLPLATREVTDTDGSLPTLTLDPTRQQQTMVGFGAALTDSSALLLLAMPRQSRERLLDELFLPSPCGAGLSMLRVTIGASDFSTHHYSLADQSGVRRDGSLRHFSLGEQGRLLLPLLRSIHRRQPHLAVIASAWSAPAWMKTSNSLIGGTLDDARFDAFSRYLDEYVSAMAANGVSVHGITLQNEPGYSPKDYPGMLLSSEQRIRLWGLHVGPRFSRRHPRVRLLEWDHNWDHPEEPLAVFRSASAGPYVHGVAWHCYGGGVEAQRAVTNEFPGKDTYISECSGGTWESPAGDSLLDQARTLLVNGTQYGARGVILWNLVLDSSGGPHAGGCVGCRPVVQLNGDGNWQFQSEFHALGHFSRFVMQGARHLEAVRQLLPEGLEASSFLNPDGSIAVVLVNGLSSEVAIVIRPHRYAARRVDIPPRSLVSVVLPSTLRLLH